MLDVAASDDSDSDDKTNTLSALQHLLLPPSAAAAEAMAAARCMLGSARLGPLNVLRFAKRRRTSVSQRDIGDGRTQF
jgi:hypothetical protein